MNKITSPFSKEQVDNLNEYQEKGFFHPFTCSGNPQITDCEKVRNTGEGILKATEQGWVCPCGHYTQNWAHSAMADKQPEQHPIMQTIKIGKKSFWSGLKEAMAEFPIVLWKAFKIILSGFISALIGGIGGHTFALMFPMDDYQRGVVTAIIGILFLYFVILKKKL